MILFRVREEIRELKLVIDLRRYAEKALRDDRNTSLDSEMASDKVMRERFQQDLINRQASHVRVRSEKKKRATRRREKNQKEQWDQKKEIHQERVDHLFNSKLGALSV